MTSHPTPTTRALLALGLPLAMAVASCGGDGEPYAEIVENGGARYFDQFEPASQVTEDGVTTYEWALDEGRGPACLRNTPFRMATQPGTSDNLFIFLQGGGACWSDFCFAIEEAGSGIPRFGLLDPEDPSNPVPDWNIAYLPYCDGSLFAGDADIDDDGDGEIDRYHRGLQNISAALDVIHDQFPNPPRIFLVGVSGGGYGTIIGNIAVRLRFPDAELIVLNDSGLGLGQDDYPEFIEGIIDEFNITPLLPDSCEGCTADGHITSLIAWELDRDPNLRIGAFSFLQDRVIGNLFLTLPGDFFQNQLLRETQELHDAFPDRFKRFLIPGTRHTTTIGDASVVVGDSFGDSLNNALGDLDTSIAEGETAGEWVDHLVNDPSQWEDRVVTEE